MGGFNIQRPDEIDALDALDQPVRVTDGGKVVIEGVLVACDSTRPLKWIRVRDASGEVHKIERGWAERL